MDKRILLSTGIHNRDWCLPYYLRNILNLQYNKKLIDIYWIVNNCSPNDKSLKILKDFEKLHKDEYNSIQIEIKNSKDKFTDDRTSKTRESKSYLWLSEIRNLIFKKCVSLNCTHLLSIDSDILVSPTLLNDLLSANQPITASLIYNGYIFSPESPWQYPNVLKYEGNGNYTHIVNYYVKNPDKAPKDKILPCGGTGAVCLISREVCENTYYKWHKLGEDLGWSDVCREKGYQMYFMPHAYSQHVMGEQLLDQFKNFGV